MLLSSRNIITCENRRKIPQLLLLVQALLTGETIGRFSVLPWSFWSLPLQLPMSPLVPTDPVCSQNKNSESWSPRGTVIGKSKFSHYLGGCSVHQEFWHTSWIPSHVLQGKGDFAKSRENICHINLFDGYQGVKNLSLNFSVLGLHGKAFVGVGLQGWLL